jgi:ATP-dependent RNA helicase RhlE
MYIVAKENKNGLLVKLLESSKGSVLIFSRTKIGAVKIARGLHHAGINVAQIHSDRTLGQRREALDGFKTGRYRVLVATDIASRGIDVQAIELVVNYDLPDDLDNYVHRIGRTGRAGHHGRAVTFAMPDQYMEVARIERMVQTQLAVLEHPDVPAAKFPDRSRGSSSRLNPRQMSSRGGFGGGRGRGGFGGGGRSFGPRSGGRR